MLRRVLLYVLVGVAVYLGYTRYHDGVLADLAAKTAANGQANAAAMTDNAREGQSEFEKALRRRETTESVAREAERSVAEAR